MNDLQLFLPCAAGTETLLTSEVRQILGEQKKIHTSRSGVQVSQALWRDMLALNLHSRLSQRVLITLKELPYRNEQEIYDIASSVVWEAWFGVAQTFKIELTSHRSPLRSLNFAALKIKDAIADRFRAKTGERPSVDTHRPDVRVYAHLGETHMILYIDTSGAPLFKRGWRQDQGDAPLKETLAAAMLAASNWAELAKQGVPLYDPCCGSGTIAIEAAQIASNHAAGLLRSFGFEKLRPFEMRSWQELKAKAQAAVIKPQVQIFGSDVAHRMVDFAERNAQRARVEDYVQFRGGDALHRMPPSQRPGIMLVNPPYGERIESGGVAPQDDFFNQLASHWKKHYAGWSAYVLCPDLKLPTRMRLKESQRTPMWNGPIECRLFRFDMVAGSARQKETAHAA